MHGEGGRLNSRRLCLDRLLRCLEFTLQSSVLHGYAPHLTKQLQSSAVSKKAGISRIWEEGSGLCSRSPPHGVPLRASGWLPSCKVTVTAQPRSLPSHTQAAAHSLLAYGSKDAIPTLLHHRSQTCSLLPFSRKFYSRREG